VKSYGFLDVFDVTNRKCCASKEKQRCVLLNLNVHLLTEFTAEICYR